MRHRLNSLSCLFTAILFSFFLLPPTFATETENLGIRILPTGAKIVIDGKTDDWDLSAGVFTCSDVENQRDSFSVWTHAMYDAENLYLLVRWNDTTPLNNPGQTVGDYGFAGDCIQFRVITRPDSPDSLGSHWTCWRGREGDDLMDVAYGTKFDGPKLKDAKTVGAKQAFLANAPSSPKGYVQEMSIPWKLLLKEGQPAPKAGDRIVITVEPNFTLGQAGRVTLKDIFKPGNAPDRVFTFMAYPCWGYGSLESSAKVAPSPLRLADAREFPVHMEKGTPVIDWNGLIKAADLKGFKTISFNMPEDGYVSLNIKDKAGVVVRQLLTTTFFTKGKHEVKWDGLTTMNWRTPGSPVAEGDYTWEGIWHKGIGLSFVGWAGNSGNSPWDATPTGNWGGDHGMPAVAASDAERVYLGWSGAEAGKALLACDLNGNILWKNSRGGMAGVTALAVDGGTVYAQNWGGNLYRLDAKTGAYTKWSGSDSCDLLLKTLWGDDKTKPENADAMDASGGRIYLAFTGANTVMVLDAGSGKLMKSITIASPSDLRAVSNTLAYVVSEGKAVLALNPETGEAKPFIGGLNNAKSLALDKDGKIYVALREPDNQVLVFGADGKSAGNAIGKKGGRSTLGKWTSDGIAFATGLTVDAAGKLWVAEGDMAPKRFSSWDTKTGKLVKEYFGPSTYGALGGAISPLDPYVMVGQGCEWRIDPKTGRDTCQGIITRGGMENSRFGVGSNGKLYLAIASRWAFDLGDVSFFERIGDGDYKLRAMIWYVDKDGKDIPPPAHGQTGQANKTAMWSDENGDSVKQPNEVTLADGIIRITGWYMGMTQDMTFYGPQGQFKLAGFSACGAPKYDLAHPVKLPTAPGNGQGSLGSADGKYVLQAGDYNVNNAWNRCYEVATGKQVWTYPDNFVGVHGSHNAVPPEVGMIRGSFGPCGSATLPKPVGNIWVLATNCGEWHVLTEDGYYLTRLFEGDPMKVKWPDAAVPGANLNAAPCGMGGEDFGGSVTYTKDGRLFVQAGKTGFWNVEVTGLENVKAIKGGGLVINAGDVKKAMAFHDEYLQAAVGTPRVAAKKLTPAFTGDLNADFKGAEVLAYKKQAEAVVRTVVSYDDVNLYVAWEVKDKTPWVNSATEAAQMYIGGDTVDLQLGTDLKADKNRGEDAAGDLRVSIGNFGGKPTAVIYRKTSGDKKPMVFSSGVIKSYPMDFVDVIAGAKIEVKVTANSHYVVEAAIPLAALNVKPADGLKLRADFGATHGDTGGRTRLRSYWSNQHTGIVDDAVFELKMEPKNFGEMTFTP